MDKIIDSFKPSGTSVDEYTLEIYGVTFKNIDVLADESYPKPGRSAKCIATNWEDETREIKVPKNLLKDNGIKYGKFSK